jgi:hypothetical protein
MRLRLFADSRTDSQLIVALSTSRGEGGLLRCVSLSAAVAMEDNNYLDYYFTITPLPSTLLNRASYPQPVPFLTNAQCRKHL